MLGFTITSCVLVGLGKLYLEVIPGVLGFSTTICDRFSCSSISTAFVCLSKTKQDLVHRIQKFFQYKLTPEKCQNYINHLRTVIPIIIERKGDWSGC